VAFVPGILITNEPDKFSFNEVQPFAWVSIIYLITIGSIAAYSAYVWLLANRPATQVSTYAYVNPVVAVLLGVLFGGETITILPVIGLAVILGSVLLLNLSEYRKAKRRKEQVI